MKKLFLEELKRAFQSLFLWLTCLVVILLHAKDILLSGYGFTVYTASFLLDRISVLCIFLAVFIVIHTGQEFENRTINLKIIAGYNRREIYMAETLVNIVCGLFLFMIHIAAAFGFSAVKQIELGENITDGDLLINSFICCTGILAVCVLFTMMVMIFHQRLKSLAVVLLLTLTLLHIGSESVSALMQPKYKTSFTEEQQREGNPLYVSGVKRGLFNTHILISPFAQAEYAPYLLWETEKEKENNSLILKNSAFHLEFAVVNFLEALLFMKIGLYVFKRQDLK